MRIAGMQKLTLLDYPGLTAATVFTPGCNLRCPFCHNSQLIAGETEETFGDSDGALAFLRTRRRLLDGVCISGGEPLLQPGIDAFCRSLKELGFSVKLDTNGTQPDRLRALLDEGLVDYVAMDHKMPAARSWKIRGGVLFDRFSECMRLLTGSGINFEVRTTVHPMLLDEADILQMIRESVGLGYDQTYYLQYFFDAGKTLGNLPPPSRRYDRGLLDERSPLPIGYRNFPEDRFKY